MKLIRSLTLMVGAMLSVGCTKTENTSKVGLPVVVATTTMVADLAKMIGGDRVQVIGLMGPGVDPHNYGGLHLEGRFQNTLEAMAKRGRNVSAVSAGIDPAGLLSPQEDFEGTKDPHVWGDPQLWKQTVDTAVAAITKADPEGASSYQANGEAYKKQLDELTAWAKEKIAIVPLEKRILVTSHDAFFYFGRAFEFKVRGLQGVSSAAEAGIKDRSNLVEYLRSQGVKTVFAETSINEKGISAVAAEAGVAVSDQPLFSDALGSPGDIVVVEGETYDKGTYVGMIKHNVNTIVKGLK
jgi:manganese/zinc/iron transport system substrate-binding protein